MKLTVGLPEREEAEREALAMAERLRAAAVDRGLRGSRSPGRRPAYVARRGDRWRYHVILRGADPVALLDPVPGAPWSIDVDPESLL